MFTKIEIKNFQSHKDTMIDFDKGINSICGESDNGKTAIIRAIRWVIENRPLGTDKLNSFWNKDFKEEMSVKLYTENGWVQRIRTKDRNGYTICTDGTPVELSAVGTDVPQEVKDFLKVNDINFQYQFDSPYLISMSSGEASKYLNNIIHLDSIDSMMSVAEGNKRTISSEQKVVDKDISDLEREIKNTEWVEEAEQIYHRIEKYDEVIDKKSSEMAELDNEIIQRENLKIIDLTEPKKLIAEIESIDIPDVSELDEEIKSYEQLKEKTIDLSVQKDLISKIESINIPDVSELDEEIKSYELENEKILKLNREREELKKQLPVVCPYCGKPLENGETLCS